ncbi:MAG: Ig-like domain-containing protein [Candidatus Tectomicrobia bacterium]|uniref:Ig-like domain-containing protein n=1 Tax=Tectimicrobiota bacterium TaxID=2528274 RepID=A0A932CM33_UNCTE|nr:Ig-like domain-containing protein [Candidatus Tectomicrobia bacterium]
MREIGTITLPDEPINITKADEPFTVTATVYDAVGTPVKDIPLIFTSTNPSVVLVERGAVADADGIATARVDFISEGEATITAHVLRAPTSNPTQEKAVGILPPSVLGSLIEAISRMGMDGARVSLLEETERGAMTTTGGGAFWMQAIRRAQASFKVEAEGYFSRVEQLHLLSLPEPVVFPLTRDRWGKPLPSPLFGPDLTGSWESLAQSCQQSRTRLACSLKGTLQVQNQGTEAAPKSLLSFYRSDDATWDEGDAWLKQMTMGVLKAGGAQKKAFSVKLPAGSSASGQFIIAMVDADDARKETNETNNPIVFGPLP